MKIIRFIWQLPQNLAGLLFLNCKKGRKSVKFFDKTDCKFFTDNNGSVSLGNYIFVLNPNNSETVNHEYGHHKQSLYLGPLYLLVIGLPSIIGYWIDVLFHENWSWIKRDKWYYNQPWEKWADKLGGVKRYYPNI